MKISTKISTLIVVIAFAFTGCEQEQLEDALSIADGGGTLTTYKAYALDSIPGAGEMYGRAVFYKGLDGKTLLQISLYNVPEDASFPSGIYAGGIGADGEELMSLYSIANTGEGYDFGEFSTSKYFVISEEGFYASLDDFDASIKIMSGATAIVAGGIGLNAVPVETN